jgi:hypothetical protein
MKTKIELTANEYQDVVDAVVARGDNLGYNVFDEEEHITSELLQIVDAALEAMSIEVVPADEEEDDDIPFDDDEDDDGNDDIDDLLYEIDGIILINRVDAEAMLNICKKYARAKYPRLKASVIDMIAGEEFQDIMKRWGAERVDMRE